MPVPMELLDRGACGGRASVFDDESETMPAKLLCASCPVRARCLDHALEFEEFGVWGGTTPEERDVMRGHPFRWTWEQRVEAQRLRTVFSRGVAEEIIAAEYAVSTRSVQRKKIEYLALTAAA
ncbi:WhiB family transcriptional regulator [Terrabacter sp. MAHUQ-38]|nr:WhiB family transcriptional regulator [Terrabacter sp. MAHUQ-38]